MQVMAVKVSLTAAERARIAISTSWSIAKTGSCISVRCGPVTCALAERDRDPVGGLWRPDHRQGPAGHEEVPRAVDKADDRVGPGRDVDELPVADELQVAAHARGDRGAAVVEEVQELAVGPPARVREREPVGSDLGEFGVDRAERGRVRCWR